MYLYSCIVLYGLTYTVISIFVFTENFNSSYLFISEFLLCFYRIWTAPLSKTKHLIKCFYIWPFKIFALFKFILTSLFKFISFALKEVASPKKSSECSGKKENDEEKKFTYIETVFNDSNLTKYDHYVDSTEWELLCFNRRKNKVMLTIDTFNSYKKSLHGIAKMIESDDNPRKEIQKVRITHWENHWAALKKININHPYLTYYEHQLTNKKFDKPFF